MHYIMYRVEKRYHCPLLMETVIPLRVKGTNFLLRRDMMVNTMVVPVIQHAAEDTDDEVRAASLDFIRVHIQGKLNKSGKRVLKCYEKKKDV